MLEPVDLGLPSGLLWSAVDLDYTKPGNVAETPFTNMKSFFSWGNIDGHNPILDRARFAYNWTAEVYGSTPGASLVTDIPASMDAARALLGSPWRTPDSVAFQELFNSCDFVMEDGTTVIPDTTADKRVTVNGIRGIYLKSRYNGRLLFFACSGYGANMTWQYVGPRCYYWSSSFNFGGYAFCLRVAANVEFPASFDRWHGLPIRPIYDPSLL